jgi:hypothetical protein
LLPPTPAPVSEEEGGGLIKEHKRLERHSRDTLHGAVVTPRSGPKEEERRRR